MIVYLQIQTKYVFVSYITSLCLVCNMLFFVTSLHHAFTFLHEVLFDLLL